MKIRITKKQAINEARSGDREAGIAVYGILKHITDAIKVANVSFNEDDVERLEEYLQDRFPKDDPSKSYSKQAIFLKNKIEKIANKKGLDFSESDYLKKLTHVVIFSKVDPSMSKDRFEIKLLDGGMSSTDKLGILELHIARSEGWDFNSKGNNFLFLNSRFKEELQDMIRHEFEHAKQNIKRTSKSIYTKIQNMSAEEQIKTIESVLNSKTKDLEKQAFKVASNYEKDSYRVEYEELLSQTLDMYKDMLKVHGKTKAQDRALYYLNPIEVEGYVVGFVRKATLRADKMVRKLRSHYKYDKNKIKAKRSDFIKMVFKKTVDSYIESLDKANDKIYEMAMESGYSEEEMEKAWTAAADTSAMFKAKLLNYAKKRYGSLKDL
jgi:hypothetical protein